MTNLLPLTWLVAGGVRGGRARLAGTVAGVGLGVTLLLLLVGAVQGLAARAERSGWTDPAGGSQMVFARDVDLADDEVLVYGRYWLDERFRGRTITRVDIAATPTSTVKVPGVGRAPAPGEYYASPALARLIAAYQPDELGNRFGVPAGVIGEDGLASPDSLVVVVGADLGDDWAGEVLHELRAAPFPTMGYQVMASIGGAAVLFPVLVLIGIVARLGQAARADRLAALRLIGATPQRVATVASIETGVATLLGAILGAVVTWLLVPLAARIRVEDERFFASDVRVGAATTVCVVSVTAVVGALVAYVTALRAGIGPLGGSRERHERRPRVVSVVPLAAGIVVLGVIRANGDHWYGSWLLLGFVGGFALIAFGVVLAGPLVTVWAGRFMARRSRGVAGVLAANRVVQHPRATFRSVSGLVIAVFIVSMLAMAVTTFNSDDVVTAPADQRVPPDVLVAPLHDLQGLDEVLVTLQAAAGVRHAVVAAWDETGWFVTAADASALGMPVTGAAGVHIDDEYFQNRAVTGPVVRPATTRQVSDEAARMVIVVTDGSPAAVERARTACAQLNTSGATTRAEDAAAQRETLLASYARLGNLAILVATGVCAVSLAVSTLAGVLDRRRVLGLLRLQGMPGSTLRTMLVAEAAVPIVTVFAACVGLGFFVAWALVTGVTDGRRTVAWPSSDYYLTVAASLALAALAVAATFRTATHSTRLAATRFE